MAAALAADQRSLQPILDSNAGAAENRGRTQKKITILKTPETDNLARGNHVVPTEWAEQLERERDQARKELSLKQQTLTIAKGTLSDLRKELNEWQTLCLWGGTPEHIHDFIKGQQTRIHEAQDIEKTCEQLERERNEALIDRANGDIATMTRNHYERILRERDEARDQSQRLRVQLNHYLQANEMAEQAFRERDEAHKIADQAIEDLAWFNQTNAQRLRNELDQLKEETK